MKIDSKNWHLLLTVFQEFPAEIFHENAHEVHRVGNRGVKKTEEAVYTKCKEHVAAVSIVIKLININVNKNSRSFFVVPQIPGVPRHASL
jgi:hypothetical protein